MRAWYVSAIGVAFASVRFELAARRGRSPATDGHLPGERLIERGRQVVASRSIERIAEAVLIVDRAAIETVRAASSTKTSVVAVAPKAAVSLPSLS